MGSGEAGQRSIHSKVPKYNSFPSIASKMKKKRIACLYKKAFIYINSEYES